LHRKRISILIATYNRPSELSSCLRAIRINKNQLDIEVCVVNDGGCSIEPIVRQFPDLNISFQDLSMNMGQVYCRNLALQMATGDWISICDDDDRFLPHHLQRMNDFATRETDNRLFLFSDVELVVHGVSKEQNGLLARKVFAWNNVEELMTKYNPIVPSSVFYHRSLHDMAGVFDEGVGHYWDWDFWLRVQPFTNLVRIPGCAVLYGIDERGSNQSSDPSKMKGDLDKLIQKHNLLQLPTSNFLRMTEDPFIAAYQSSSRVLWDGDMQIWK
jgi:glycosyltransferase involved in cell wall biosynthesis